MATVNTFVISNSTSCECYRIALHIAIVCKAASDRPADAAVEQYHLVAGCRIVISLIVIAPATVHVTGNCRTRCRHGIVKRAPGAIATNYVSVDSSVCSRNRAQIG